MNVSLDAAKDDREDVIEFPDGMKMIITSVNQVVDPEISIKAHEEVQKLVREICKNCMGTSVDDRIPVIQLKIVYEEN